MFLGVACEQSFGTARVWVWFFNKSSKMFWGLTGVNRPGEATALIKVELRKPFMKAFLRSKW